MIFPIYRTASPDGWSAMEYREAFLNAKPAHLVWFAYDVVIHSRTDIEFIVYEMLDSVDGGIGSKVATITVNVPASLTEDDVEHAILRAARKQRADALEAVERARIEDIAAQIRTAIRD